MRTMTGIFFSFVSGSLEANGVQKFIEIVYIPRESDASEAKSVKHS
jgi:hypothetical protein